MSIKQVNMREAKSRLSELGELVWKGETVVSAKAGKPYLDLLPHRPERRERKPILIGTWAAAAWAIRFYEKRGYRLVAADEKDRLLAKYWRVPSRQVETSVVLASPRWRGLQVEQGS